MFFLDSDDWLAEGAFFHMAEKIKNTSCIYDLILVGAQKVDADSNERQYIGRTFEKNIDGICGKDALELILKKDKKFEWYAWRYLYRLEYLRKNTMRFLQGRYYEDVEWTPRAFYCAECVGYLASVCVNYWFHNPTSILNTPSIKKSIDKIEIASMACQFAEQEINKKVVCNIICATFSSLYLSGFGDYLNGSSELIEVLKNNRNLLKYSDSRLGKILNYTSKVVGFKRAADIIRWGNRIRNRIKNI